MGAMRDLDIIVRDSLGNQAVEIIRLTSALELAQDQIDQLKSELEKAKAASKQE